MFKLRHHILFWLAITVLLVGIFGKVFNGFSLSFYFVAMLLPVVVGTSYFFNFYLVPHFLLKKRYARFCLYFIYMFIVSVYLEMLVIAGSFVLLAHLNYDKLSPTVTNIFVLAVVLYFIVFLTAFLLLIRRSFKIENKSKSLKAEKNKFLKGSITVRSDRKQAKRLFEEIYYIESKGDYVKIVTDSGSPVMTHERISHILKDLSENFLRIHRSFIVNGHKVRTFSKKELQIDGSTLPISRTYKKQVTRQLSK